MKTITIIASTDWGGWDYGDNDESEVHDLYNDKLARLVAAKFLCRVTVENGDANPDKITFEGFEFYSEFTEDDACQIIQEIGESIATDDDIYPNGTGITMKNKAE